MALVVRDAGPADVATIESLVFGDPAGEAAILAGGVEPARRFGRAVIASAAAATWPASKMAELDGEVVGVLQQGEADDEFQPTPRFVWSVVRALGLWTSLRLLPRGWALQRVRLAAPADAWVVREVHVDPTRRNRGIGRALLAEAEAEGRRRGFRVLALTTRTDNPARRLYEREGYRVATTKSDARYERLTGAEGRVLMVKQLTGEHTFG